MSKKPVSETYVVTFDTSNLRGRPGMILSQAVKKFISEYAGDPRVKMRLVLPEVVLDEWAQNYTLVGLGEINSIFRAERILKEQLRLKREEVVLPSEENLRTSARTVLEGLGFEIFDTQYANIDFQNLILRAVKHQPPFEGRSEEKGDKGIKDGVIVESFEHIRTSLKPNEKLVIIATDGKLTAYLEEKLEGSYRLYTSITEFESDLELALNALSKELTKIASIYFYAPSDQESIFYKLGIRNTLLEKYKRAYPEGATVRLALNALPTSLSQYISDETTLAESSSSFAVSATVFKGKDSSRLIWESTVILNAEYNLEQADEEGQTIGGARKVVHKVEFAVTWSSAITKLDKITRPKITDYKMISESRSFINPQPMQNTLRGILDNVTRLQASRATTISGLPTISVPQIDPVDWKAISKSVESINRIVKPSDVFKDIYKPTDTFKALRNNIDTLGKANMISSLHFSTHDYLLGKAQPPVTEESSQEENDDDEDQDQPAVLVKQ